MRRAGIYSQLTGDSLLVTDISGFTTSDRYATANGTGHGQANASNFSAFVVMLPNLSANNQWVFGKSTGVSGSTGWSINCAVGFYRFTIGDGTTAKHSSSTGFTDSEVGKMCVLHGVCRSGNLYIYKNGVLVFGATEISSYGSNTLPISIGSLGGGGPFESGIIACGIWSTKGLTDQEVEDEYQSLLLNPYHKNSDLNYHWRGIDAGTTWADTVGGLVATKQGNPTINSQAREWYARYNYNDYVSDSVPLSPALDFSGSAVKLLIKGDSRTVGTGGTGTNSYRNGLGNSVIADSDISNMNFVGPVSSSAVKPAHNGYSGSTAGMHLNGISQPTPATIMSTYDPDVILIWLGANSGVTEADLTQGKQDYLDLIRALHALKPSVRFIVTEESDHGNPGTKARMEDYNKWLWTIAWPTLITEGIELIRVKLFTVIKIKDGDFSDTVHPNDTGYAKLAAAFYPALRLACGFS